MENKISRFSALNLAATVTRQTLTRVACLAATILLAPGLLVQADASAGKIIVSGDEWTFSNDGLPNNPAYVTNVVNWFGLDNGTGKKVLILDGQSWNSGYNGTQGAFGSDFRSLLTGMGVAVIYLGYQDDLVPLAGYDAVFVDGLMVKATTLTNDLADFVGAGGAVFLAGGTGTFSPANATAEAAYWQPFLAAATGSGDFGLVGGSSWFEENPPLQVAGPIGDGVTILKWYMGQGVQVGSNLNARAAIWDSARTLVATWSASLQNQWTTNNLPSGLIAWWQAEGNLLDSAGGHHGGGASFPVYAPGRHGQAFHFDGVSQSVVIPDGPPDLDNWTQFTLEAWVNLDNTIDGDGGGQAIISKVGNGRTGPNWGYQFGFGQSASKLYCQFNTSGQAWPGFQTIADLGASVPTNVWLHVAATYDHNAVKLYLNGVPLVTNTIGPVTIVDSPSNLRLNGDDNLNVFFAGRIDDARIYNRALTGVEVASVAQRLTLVGSGCTGTNFSFWFQTVSNFSYTVQYNNDLLTTNWQFLETMTGDGSLMPCLVPMTNATQRFLRVRQP